MNFLAFLLQFCSTNMSPVLLYVRHCNQTLQALNIEIWHNKFITFPSLDPVFFKPLPSVRCLSQCCDFSSSCIISYLDYGSVLITVLSASNLTIYSTSSIIDRAIFQNRNLTISLACLKPFSGFPLLLWQKFPKLLTKYQSFSLFSPYFLPLPFPPMHQLFHFLRMAAHLLFFFPTASP